MEAESAWEATRAEVDGLTTDSTLAFWVETLNLAVSTLEEFVSRFQRAEESSVTEAVSVAEGWDWRSS